MTEQLVKQTEDVSKMLDMLFYQTTHPDANNRTVIHRNQIAQISKNRYLLIEQMKKDWENAVKEADEHFKEMLTNITNEMTEILYRTEQEAFHRGYMQGVKYAEMQTS